MAYVAYISIRSITTFAVCLLCILGGSLGVLAQLAGGGALAAVAIAMLCDARNNPMRAATTPVRIATLLLAFESLAYAMCGGRGEAAMAADCVQEFLNIDPYSSNRFVVIGVVVGLLFFHGCVAHHLLAASWQRHRAETRSVRRKTLAAFGLALACLSIADASLYESWRALVAAPVRSTTPALIVGAAAALAAASCMLFVLLRRRLVWYEGAPVCDSCGYEMVTTAARCPECGQVARTFGLLRPESATPRPPALGRRE